MKTRYCEAAKAEQANSCGLIKDLKTRYYKYVNLKVVFVVVWLKIWKHDIKVSIYAHYESVVVWLKIWKHDILCKQCHRAAHVVVWLKIWKHDIMVLR